MKRVTILYKWLPEYRRAFFEELKEALAKEGVSLQLSHGHPDREHDSKRDEANIDWATVSKNHIWRIGGRQLIWQSPPARIRQADLVIVEQASRLLINYLLLAGQLTHLGPKIAFWGHGANLQTHTASKLSEAMKRKYSKFPHWWFAYTDGTSERVAALGYPRERITVVQNAIDTSRLQHDIAQIQPSAKTSFLQAHGATSGSVGLYIGSLYHEKRLSFLCEAAVEINRHRPDFVLFIAGDGPERDEVIKESQRYPFIRYLGRVDGAERALVLSVSDVVLMPGLVGLAILDAFASGCPVVTTNIAYHSPEIEYLEDGRNGILAPDTDYLAYARAVIQLLGNVETLSVMVDNCYSSARRYTNEEMVHRFKTGILSALTSE